MKQTFQFYFAEMPTGKKDNNSATRSANLNLEYIDMPTVADLTRDFREFLKAVGVVNA